jgi:hypothetical protein
MVLPKNPSWWHFVLYLVALPFEAVIWLGRAIFLPKEGSPKPIGYEWYDDKGNRHVHYYVYRRDKRH